MPQKSILKQLSNLFFPFQEQLGGEQENQVGAWMTFSDLKEAYISTPQRETQIPIHLSVCACIERSFQVFQLVLDCLF